MLKKYYLKIEIISKIKIYLLILENTGKMGRPKEI